MTERPWAVEFSEHGRREFDLVPPAYRNPVYKAIDELLAAGQPPKQDANNLERPGFTVYYEIDQAQRVIWVTGVEHFWRMDKPRWGLIGPGLISG